MQMGSWQQQQPLHGPMHNDLHNWIEAEKHSLAKMWKRILDNSSIHGIKYLDR